MIHKDICAVTREEVVPYIPKRALIVTSGMPCETFFNRWKYIKIIFMMTGSSYTGKGSVLLRFVMQRSCCLKTFGDPIQTSNKDSDKLIVDQIEEETNEHGFTNHKRFVLDSYRFWRSAETT